MAIGDRTAGRSPTRAYSRQQANPRAFGAGVAQAIGNLASGVDDFAGTFQDISNTVAKRRDKEEDFDAEKRYIEFVGGENRAQAERIRNTSENAAGITDNTEAAVGQSYARFKETLPERLRSEYDVKFESYRQQTVTSAFNYEYTAGNEKFVKDVNQTMNGQASEVLLGNKSAEEAFEEVSGLIGKSDLDEASQRDLTTQAETFLLKAEFQKEIEYASEFRGTVTPRTEGDVVASGLQSHERGILNAISSPESSDRYDVLYGGGKIKDFSDHPRQFITITSGPNKGMKSSAAGKYQFLSSTWDAAVKRYNTAHPNSPVTDFSPESQDRIAINHARYIYNRQQGPGELNFDQVLTSGNRDLIISMKDVLWDDNGGWEGFRGMSDDAFANTVMGSKGIAGGGTGTPNDPDIWNNPRYANLSFGNKNVLANSAQKAVNARDAASATLATARQNEITEQTMMDAIQGKHTLADLNYLIKNGSLADSSDVTKWKNLTEEANKGQAERQRISAALNGNGQLYSEDNKGLNAYLGTDGQDALRQQSPEYASQILLPIASKAGYFPSDSAKMLNDMVLGSNGKAREYATGILAAAASADPRVLDRSPGLSESAQKQVILTNQLRGLYPPEEIQTRLRELNDPKQQGVINQARKDGRKLFDENYTSEDIIGQFDTWMPGDAAGPALDRGQNAALRSDYQTAFVEGYLISGDEGKAVEYANELVQRHWGATAVGGSRRVTKYAPEVYYPTIDGAHEWVDQQARNELGFGEDTQFQLIPDAQTETEGKRYNSAEDKSGMNNASYQVVFLNENGLPEVMLSDGGEPLRWAAEITPKMKQRMEIVGQYKNLDAEREAIIEAAAAGGAMPEGTTEKLNQLSEQMQELDEQNGGNALQVIPGHNLKDLEDERGKLEEALTKAKSRPGAGNPARIRRKLELINLKLENL